MCGDGSDTGTHLRSAAAGAATAILETHAKFLVPGMRMMLEGEDKITTGYAASCSETGCAAARCKRYVTLQTLSLFVTRHSLAPGLFQRGRGMSVLKGCGERLLGDFETAFRFCSFRLSLLRMTRVIVLSIVSRKLADIGDNARSLSTGTSARQATCWASAWRGKSLAPWQGSGCCDCRDTPSVLGGCDESRGASPVSRG
jgi:hypothetical protein